MRAIWILGMMALTGCVGDVPAEFGGETVGVGGAGGGEPSRGDGGSASASEGGSGGAASPSSSAESSASTGAGGAGSSSSSAEASSSSSGIVEPVSECHGAARGAACAEGGGHLCDGAGTCVEFIGVKCKVSGVTYVCGDGVPRPVIISDTVACNGGVTEWPYAPPGEWCTVGGVAGSGVTL